MRKLVLGISSLLCLGACGGKFGETRASTNGTAGGGAAGSPSASTTNGSGGGGSGGSNAAGTTSDLAGASSSADAGEFPCCKDADLYQCGTGSCDPDTEYCFNAIDATGHSELSCQPIPKQCLSAPQCACIASAQPSPRACQCADESVVRMSCFGN